MRRYWRPEDWYDIHSDRGPNHLAVNVKMPNSFYRTIQKLDIPNNEAGNIFDLIVDNFWNCEIDFICDKVGYKGAHSEGRSNGWCVPYISKTGSTIYYPNFEFDDRGVISIPDTSERNRFLSFYTQIQLYKKNIPNLVKEYAQEILDY